MKSRLVFLAIVCVATNSFAQVDTLIHLPKVEVIEVSPSSNYTVSHIDTNLLLSNETSSLDELLTQGSDVFIKDYGAGALSAVSFRGMGSSHTKIYWNGISLNSSMNGTFDLSLLNLSSTDRVDVHYGASSLIDGSGSIGGSVKLKSMAFFNQPTQILISQSVGSFSTYKTQAKIRVSNKKLYADVRFAYVNSRNDFEYLNPSKTDVPKEIMNGADFNNFNISTNVGWMINSKNSLELFFIHQQSERNLPKLNVQEKVNESQNDFQNIGFLEWRNYGKKVINDLKVGVKLSELDYRNENIQFTSKSKETDFFVQDRLKYKLFKKVESSSSFLYDYIETFNDKYGEEKVRNEFQLIHDFQLKLFNKWKAGLLIKSHFTDNVSLPLLPSVNLGFNAIKDVLTLSGSVSYHGAIPSMNDLYWGEGGNVDLKPEKGISTELNLSGNKKVKKSNVNYRISGYYSDIDDWILWSPDQSGIWRVSNVGNVKSYGNEASIGFNTEIKKSMLYSKIAYNWNISEDEKGRQLLYVPIHRMKLNLGWKWKSLALNYNHQFTDQRFINSENSAWLPSYFLADCSISYNFKINKNTKIRTFFKVNNLYDEPFQSVANRPMPFRYYTLTVSYLLR